MEFIFDKKYNKMFKPVFSDLYYDFDAVEMNGIITFVLTPRPDIKPKTKGKMTGKHLALNQSA